jgi:transposase
MSMFYGIDLAREKFKGAVVSATSDETTMITCALSKESLKVFMNRLTVEDYVVVEATTNAFWFVEQIRDHVKECFVVDPMKFSIISQSKKKTDSIDAIKLAKKLKYYVLFDQSKDEFPTIFIPSHTIQEIRSLFTTYETIKKEKNITKNRIRSLLTQNGFFGQQKKDLSYNKTREEILALPISECLRTQLEVLFSILTNQLDAMETIKSTILCKGIVFQKEVALLTSIRGISPFVAIAIMADVVDVDRFCNAKHFCSYLRATPRVDASGMSTKIGHVNKHSRHLSMSMLVECINHFRVSSSCIENFYLRKSKGKSKGKVRVAIVRKMLVIIYNMLTKQELYYYRDSQNHERKLKEFEKVIKMVA